MPKDFTVRMQFEDEIDDIMLRESLKAAFPDAGIVEIEHSE